MISSGLRILAPRLSLLDHDSMEPLKLASVAHRPLTQAWPAVGRTQCPLQRMVLMRTAQDAAGTTADQRQVSLSS